MTSKLLYKIFNKKIETKQMSHIWNTRFGKILSKIIKDRK